MSKKTRYQKAEKLARRLSRQIDNLYSLPKDSPKFLFKDVIIHDLILSALMNEKRNSNN